MVVAPVSCKHCVQWFLQGGPVHPRHMGRREGREEREGEGLFRIEKGEVFVRREKGGLFQNRIWPVFFALAPCLVPIHLALCTRWWWWCLRSSFSFFNFKHRWWYNDAFTWSPRSVILNKGAEPRRHHLPSRMLLVKKFLEVPYHYTLRILRTSTISTR